MSWTARLANDTLPDEQDALPEETGRTADLLVNGVAIVAGVATKKGVEALWRSLRNEDPPKNPAADDVPWRDALSWAAAVGAAMGVARVLGRRGATAAWRQLANRS